MKIKEREQGKQIGRDFSKIPPAIMPMKKDECKTLCDRLGKEYLNGYEDRVLQYTTTTEVADRYGDIVRAMGADFSNYNKNPVVMFSHQHDNFPVGCSLEHWVDPTNKCVLSKSLFLDNRVDSSGRSDLVYKFAKSKFLPAVSIGFLPHSDGVNRPTSKAEREQLGLGEHGLEYTKWDYLEHSPCGIPANPQALQNSLDEVKRSGVLFEEKDFDLIFNIKLLNENLLDMFRDKVKTEPKIFSIPSKKTIEEVVPEEKKEVTEIEVKVDISDFKKQIEEVINPLLDNIEKRIKNFEKSLEEISSKLTTPDPLPQQSSELEVEKVLDIYEKVLSKGINISEKL